MSVARLGFRGTVRLVGLLVSSACATACGATELVGADSAGTGGGATELVGAGSAGTRGGVTESGGATDVGSEAGSCRTYTACQDADGDGHLLCEPGQEAGVPEECIDCGDTDPELQTLGYLDADGDGYVVGQTRSQPPPRCSPPSCDRSRPSVRVGRPVSWCSPSPSFRERCGAPDPGSRWPCGACQACGRGSCRTSGPRVDGTASGSCWGVRAGSSFRAPRG